MHVRNGSFGIWRLCIRNECGTAIGHNYSSELELPPGYAILTLRIHRQFQGPNGAICSEDLLEMSLINILGELLNNDLCNVSYGLSSI